MKDTLVKEILGAAGKEYIVVPDYIILNDTLAPETVEKLMQLAPRDAQRIIVFIDHDTPNSSIAVGELQRKLIDWAVANNVCLEKNQGVGYLRLLETYLRPGQLVLGTGKHLAGLGANGVLGLSLSEADLLQVLQTGTYTFICPQVKKVTLTGTLPQQVFVQDAALCLAEELQKENLQQPLILLSGADTFSLDDRYTFCHLLQQAGARSALWTDASAAADTFSLAAVQPVMALPGEAEQIEKAENLPQLSLDEVFIGGCRGGKLEDLRAAAAVLKGKQIACGLHVIIAPATSRIYLQALAEGLIDIFLDCGAVVMNQGCSVCWGKAQGILDAGEILVSTGSYHYPGCSGDKTAKVYLASPAAAARCAITGKLA